ncbi:MAG TPA: branched-chain amino acid transporter AzlD [Epulopiscium sp.]|nr:branched-chain amino acid transporter AzlD [Candidatus Epulonipiscium sp.]
MMLTPTQSLIIILAIAVTTFLTRVIPFILFPDNKETPKFIIYLGKVLPYSAIGMLVIYCLKDVSFKDTPFGLPETISILAIALLHKWKKNTLISIGGGTVLYMIIVQGIL